MAIAVGCNPLKEKRYEGVPPVAEMVIIPDEPPAHKGLVTLGVLNFSCVGSLMVSASIVKKQK